MVLSASEIDRFIHDGFVKLDGAFSRETAAACRDILWRDMKLSPDRPEEWKEPVIRLGMYDAPPFREAAASPRLNAALDQLYGAGRWIPLQALGSMVVRFPIGKPWDDGWHLDASFPPPGEPHSLDYFKWRVNYASRDRGMLMLFLFSDCGENDAPTRVRVGSHLPTARQLLKYGEDGISLEGLIKDYYESSALCEVAQATGEAGAVWLLHPLMVHAAQAHHGREVRFLAQPGLQVREQPKLERADCAYSPVEIGLRLGLGR